MSNKLTESKCGLKVYKMLEGLDSDDPKVQDAAQRRVDAYLNDKQRKWDEDMLNKKVTKESNLV